MDLRLEDRQIPVGVLNVIPGVIDLAFWLHCGQHGSRPRGIMTVGAGLDPREVDTRVTSLVVDVAGEIPVQVSAASSDRRVRCLGDEITTPLVDVLEKEGYVIPSRIPSSFEQRVLASGPRSDGGVIKVGEVVIKTMDDNGCGLDFSGVVSVGGLAADSQRETKRKETDASHEGEDDADEADLLSPSPLLLGCSDAASSE